MDRGFAEPQGSRIAPHSFQPSMTPAGEDANPLNRRLPAEVIRRQPKVSKAPVQEKVAEEVQVDLRTALALKADARPKWLGKAFKMAEEGKASRTELYDILTSRKFAAGIRTNVGRKLHALAIENAHLFSEKQRRAFQSDEWVFAKYAEKEKEEEKEEEDEEEEKGSSKKADTAPPAAASREEKGSSKKASDRDRLSGVFDAADAKDGRPREQPKGDGSWTSQERQDIVAREKAHQDAAKRAKREAFERTERANVLEREARIAKEREQQQQQAKQRQAEEEADNSLDLLERLAQQREQRASSPVQEKKSRRKSSRDRDRDRDRDRRKRGMSRSRSISVQAASPSRSRGRERKRRKDSGKDGGDFKELLKARMAQRDREIDSARIAVVDPGHAQRWK